jgi:4-hydroxy-tetrahydrodipicolinate synthase
MSAARLSGVIAAVATPIDESGAPDLKRAVNLARYLLDNGCDGLNVLDRRNDLFSLDERKAVMDAYKITPAIAQPDGQDWCRCGILRLR